MTNHALPFCEAHVAFVVENDSARRKGKAQLDGLHPQRRRGQRWIDRLRFGLDRLIFSDDFVAHVAVVADRPARRVLAYVTLSVTTEAALVAAFFVMRIEARTQAPADAPLGKDVACVDG